MRCLECSQKSTIQFTEIAWHWTIVFSLNISCSLNISFFFCLIFLTKFSDIYIFSVGIKSNNLPYFVLWSSIVLSPFFIVFPPYLQTLLSVWFQLHWAPLLPFFSLSQTLKEIKRFYLRNLSKQMSPQLHKGKKN